MKSLLSLIFGALTATGVTLIHQTLPPFGLMVSLITTFTGIWWVGRYYGKKRYKLWALLGWLIVIVRAGSYGVGQELLIQGDNAGSALLLVGFSLGILAVLRKI
ncbi:MAG: hypothetical protein NTY85_05605 [Actinobacteria bacterium]|nr:hypothetical protein [Actinomycetota bacterium]